MVARRLNKQQVVEDLSGAPIDDQELRETAARRQALHERHHGSSSAGRGHAPAGHGDAQTRGAPRVHRQRVVQLSDAAHAAVHVRRPRVAVADAREPRVSVVVPPARVRVRRRRVEVERHPQPGVERRPVPFEGDAVQRRGPVAETFQERYRVNAALGGAHDQVELTGRDGAGRVFGRGGPPDNQHLSPGPVDGRQRGQRTVRTDGLARLYRPAVAGQPQFGRSGGDGPSASHGFCPRGAAASASDVQLDQYRIAVVEVRQLADGRAPVSRHKIVEKRPCSHFVRKFCGKFEVLDAFWTKFEQ